MKNLLKKIALTLTLIIGITTFQNQIIANASERNRAATVWVSEGRFVRDVPIGTTVSAGISLLSIKLGIPSSKPAQAFLTIIGIPLSSIVNDELKVVIYQYRSKYKIDGRYKYKHSYLYQWKGQTFYKQENEFFTERPYKINGINEELLSSSLISFIFIIFARFINFRFYIKNKQKN